MITSKGKGLPILHRVQTVSEAHEVSNSVGTERVKLATGLKSVQVKNG
jgi:hypothetical protein